MSTELWPKRELVLKLVSSFEGAYIRSIPVGICSKNLSDRLKSVTSSTLIQLGISSALGFDSRPYSKLGRELDFID